MDVQKELGANPILLLIVQSADYQAEVVRSVRSLAGKRICYVTLNKTCASLHELFKREKIDLESIVFVDTVSSALHQTPARTKNCHFTTSPLLLSEVFGTITRLDLANFDCLIFDSLTNLAAYDNNAALLNFFFNLTSHARESGTSAVFYALQNPSNEAVIRDLSKFVDKVLSVER
ncbi:MAG: hypothetical protein KGH63_00300 [Candidatus Micrarchaeota archaeon]|nr:hypothetical protein [Candidatus Micrarchaeota archaeon]